MIFLISYAQRILSLWERKFQIKIKIQSSNTLSYIVESRDRFITDSKERSDTIYKKMKDKLSWADPDKHLRLWERKVSRVKNDINMVAVSPLFTTFTPTFIMGRYKVSITKNQYRYHFLESRNHQRESKSIGFIFSSWFLCVLLALKRLKFFKFWVCLGVLRVNRKFINYFISSVFVSGLREPVVHLYFQFNFVSWIWGKWK